MKAGSELRRGEPLFPRVEIRVEEAKPAPIKPEIS